MFRHNLLITYRNFLHYKSTFLINLIGLSTGLACVLLIYLWVADELSVDKFHQKEEHLYKVMRNMPHPEGIKTRENTSALLGESLLKEMPEVELVTTVNTSNSDEYNADAVITYEDKHIKAKGIYASEDFFNVFSWHLIQGSTDQVLKDKNGVVISESLAKKLFNTTDNVIGKTISLNQRRPFEGVPHISGIFRDPSVNSTMHFDFVFNFKKLLEADKYAGEWNAGPAETYLILKKGTRISEFNKKIAGYMSSKVANDKSLLFVSRYSDKYLYGNYLYYVKLNEDMVSYSGEIIKDSSIAKIKGQPDPFHYQEGPGAYKRKGHYYMAYAATCCPEGIGYAMSNSPTGPWIYKGMIMDGDKRSSGNHPGIVDYKGDSYVFGFNYEISQRMMTKHSERRSICVEKWFTILTERFKNYRFGQQRV